MRFYNLKIGIPWADTQNRVDHAAVLACCGEKGMATRSVESEPRCTMGIDTGRQLHVVISRFLRDGDGKREVIYVSTRQEYAELDELMSQFHIQNCVVDALPEIHATRDFANRFSGRVYMNYFVESQRGSYSWDYQEHIVRENRTEALDASRKIIRDRRVVLPRGGEVIREFADHVAADVKQLVEGDQTGEQSYRYLRTGADHYSLAFTYDCIAWSRDTFSSALPVVSDEPFFDRFLHGRF